MEATLQTILWVQFRLWSAASPGRHNARMLAKIANIPEVRQALKENHNIETASTFLLRRTQYHYR
jgi:hypothetical protein